MDVVYKGLMRDDVAGGGAIDSEGSIEGLRLILLRVANTIRVLFKIGTISIIAIGLGFKEPVVVVLYCVIRLFSMVGMILIPLVVRIPPSEVSASWSVPASTAAPATVSSAATATTAFVGASSAAAAAPTALAVTARGGEGHACLIG